MVSAIINHAYNEEVNTLRKGFEPYIDVFALDSGSKLTVEQEKYFDVILQNVYYCGQLNGVYEQFKDEDDDFVIYFIASDVAFSDYKLAVEKLKEAFSDPSVGLYAPSAQDSSHKFMRKRDSDKLREVTFVEGFCFAVRLGLLKQVLPVDTETTLHGWGLDIYIGYLAMINGYKSVVDYGVEVYHPMTKSYDSTNARAQRDKWLSTVQKKNMFFQKRANFPLLSTKFGLSLLRSFIH